MKNDTNPGFSTLIYNNLSAIFRVTPVAILVLLLLAGCSESVEKIPETIQLHSGGSQTGPRGTLTALPVEIQVLGPERLSSSTRRPVPNIAVKITPLSLTGEPVEADILEGATDTQGIFSA